MKWVADKWGDSIKTLKKRVRKGGKKKKPSFPAENPYIQEVTKDGIKFQYNLLTLFTDRLMEPIRLLHNVFSFARYGGRDKREFQEAIGKEDIYSNYNLEILLGLNFSFPEEIRCLQCEEGVVAECGYCEEGVVSCGNCGGDYEQDCGDCDGAGEFECHDCEGRGLQTCVVCDGDGILDCEECEGGKVDCDGCDATGKDEDGEECSQCGGEKENICEPCDGDGQYACDDCAGVGEYECEICDGSGRLTCEYCDGGGMWYCQECEYGSWECGECEGHWQEHQCRNCRGRGMWNADNTPLYKKLLTLNKLIPMEKRKELLTDGLRKMALKTIHIPHTESSSYQDSINQVEAIENLKWKVNYYDGLDFNPKKIPITSFSLLMVQIPNANIEGDKPNSQYNFYAITSPSMWGKKEYPTWGVKIVNGIENRLGPRWRWDQKGSTIKGRIVDGKNDWGTKVFPPSKNYMERVVLLRSNWYFDKPLFLNWLDESPLEEKN